MGKRVLARIERESVHALCTAILDNVKINEQKKSIATGPFLVCTEYEPIWTFLPEDVAVLNRMRYRT